MVLGYSSSYPFAGADYEDSDNKTMQETSGYNFTFRIFAFCFGTVPEVQMEMFGLLKVCWSLGKYKRERFWYKSPLDDLSGYSDTLREISQIHGISIDPSFV